MRAELASVSAVPGIEQVCSVDLLNVHTMRRLSQALMVNKSLQGGREAERNSMGKGRAYRRHRRQVLWLALEVRGSEGFC